MSQNGVTGRLPSWLTRWLGGRLRTAIVRLVTSGFALFALVQIGRSGGAALASDDVRTAMVVAVIGTLATVLQVMGDRAAGIGNPIEGREFPQ